VLAGSTGLGATGELRRLSVDLVDENIIALPYAPRATVVLPDGKIAVGTGASNQAFRMQRFLGDSDPLTCAPVTVVVASSPNPSTYGQAVTLTATLTPGGPGTPTGTVVFSTSAATLGTAPVTAGGTASLTTTILDGSFGITAAYSGDGAFAPATSAPQTHHVLARISVNDRTVNAADGPTSVSFTVTRTPGTLLPVSVHYATVDRSAKAGIHYTATSGTIDFGPIELSRIITVPVAQSTPGLSRDFFLTLTSPGNATLAKGAGIGTITYATSGSLALSIDDPSVREGQGGVTLLGFTVSLSKPANSTVTVDYATSDLTGVAGTDYVAASGTLSFAPGQTARWVLVPVLGNLTPSADRTLSVTLTGAGATAITKSSGTGTIVDDDPATPAGTAAQYRLYSTVTKEHHYTIDTLEYAALGSIGWLQEGVAYTMFTDTGFFGSGYPVPMYRLYHAGIAQHHWTTDAVETRVLAAGTWSYEGISGYLLPAPEAGTTPLHRLRFPGPPLQHLWTTSDTERGVLVTQGWVYEGVLGHVLP